MVNKFFQTFDSANSDISLQGQDRQEAYFQRASPFLRRHSHYALDFYTAVLVLTFYVEHTVEEIKAEFDMLAKSIPYMDFGPDIKTIRRWLKLFKRDAMERTAFFIQKLKEHNLAVPVIPPLEERAQKPDYPSRYFLECICSLHFQLHPESKRKFQFLWHAEALLRNRFNRGLFTIRSP